MIRTFILSLLLPGEAYAEFITLQSTTSTQNSGLYQAILPQFTATSGIEVRVIAVGTGQAIRNAQNCDGDVLLVHARTAEDAFVAAGYGQARYDVMYNDFVLIGPNADPATVRAQSSAVAAFTQIALDQSPFASRADDSGTHQKEMALWDQANIDVTAASGTWYRETGSGMGATLNIAAGMNAYTLSDRATWIAFGNKADLTIVFEGDAELFNQYGIIAVNPDHCANVKAQAAQVFVDWILGDGQDAIAAYRLNGEALFTPNAQ